MAPKANLLTTDEVAGVMKTAMEKPSGRPVVEPKWWTRLMAVVDDVSKRNDELRAELKQAQAAAAAASTSAAAAATVVSRSWTCGPLRPPCSGAFRPTTGASGRGTACAWPGLGSVGRRALKGKLP